MGAPTIDDVALAIVGFLNAEIMAAGHGLEPDNGLAAAGVDSMALLKILLFIEQTYGFWIPDEDLVPQNVVTARALAGYVANRLSAG
jgi:diaminopimelate decarboxylase